MSGYLLGIDNGGTVTKAALFDLEGSEICVESERSINIALHDGFAERNMTDLWEANVRVISTLLKASGVSGSEILAVSFAGHGDGLYLLGENGKILTNGILSSDRRAEEYVQRWYSDGTFHEVFPKIKQSIWSGQSAPILSWLRDNDPDILSEARSILMCKDYIRYRMTGKIFGEYTDMSGSGLLNVAEGTYDQALLKLYGLRCVEGKLPPLLRSSEKAGEILPEVAAMTGLRVGTPVVAGMWDIVACSIANGLVDETRLCVVAGTWSINQYISTVPPTDDSVFITARYCIPSYWLILEGSPTSASNLEWFVNRLLQGIEFSGERGTVYEYCDDLVAGVEPCSSNLVFLPFLFGSNAGPHTRAGFIGLEGWHDKAQILAAIYEGIVWSHRVHIEKLSQYKSLPQVVRWSGGAARSKVWVQMFADGLGLDVEVSTARETGALGAAICAGVGSGQFETFEAAAKSMVHTKDIVCPISKNTEVYNWKFNHYKAAVEALRTYGERVATLQPLGNML